MRSEPTQQELNRLNMTQLIEHGHQAIRMHDYARAASLFREGLRRAPLRQELKDGLTMAIEGQTLSRKSARPFPPGQQPSPQSPAPAAAEYPPDPELPEARPNLKPVHPVPVANEPPRAQYQTRRAEPTPIPPRFPQARERDPEPPTQPFIDKKTLPPITEFAYGHEDDAEPAADIYREPPPTPNRYFPLPQQTSPEPKASNGAPGDHHFPRERFRPAPPEQDQRTKDQKRTEPEWPEELYRPIARTPVPDPAPVPTSPPPETRIPSQPSQAPARPPQPQPRSAAQAPSPPPRARRKTNQPPLPEVDPLYGTSLPPPARAHHPDLYARRRRRRPVTALFLGVLIGLLLVVLGGGFYIVYNNYGGGERGGTGFFSQAKFRNVVESATLYQQRREYARAREQLLTLPQSAERDKLLAEVANEIGDEMYGQNNYEGAIDSYNEALAFDQNNPRYGNNLGESYFRLGMARNKNRQEAEKFWSRARKYHEAVLINSPKDLREQIRALAGLEKIAIQQRDDKLLDSSWRKIIEIAPDSPEARDARRNLQSRGFKL